MYALLLLDADIALLDGYADERALLRARTKTIAGTFIWIILQFFLKRVLASLVWLASSKLHVQETSVEL